MNKEKFKFGEFSLDMLLKDKILRTSEKSSGKSSQKADMKQFEMISQTETPYVSPIFSMNEDEILAFVEEFDVRELATLSVAELNHIGSVLGVDPKILVEGED